MKKIFFILILILFTNSNLLAGCKQEGLDWGWKWKSPQSVEFWFKNTTNKHFWINKLSLATASDQTVVQKKTTIHIQPFGTRNTFEPVGGRGQERISLSGINTDVIEFGNIFCLSLTEAEAQQKRKAILSARKSSLDKRLGSSDSFEWKWWYIFIVIAVIGFIGSLIEDKKTKNSKPKKEKVFYSDQYGWSFSGKYILLAVPAIVGLNYFDNSFIRIIIGIYLVGCIIGFIKGDK